MPKSKNRPLGFFIVLATGIGLIVLAWFVFAQWLLSPGRTSELSALGTFGDSFGALNTLFSGLAFFGVAVSVWLQKKELDETKSQLSEERRHRERSSFEPIFFYLFELHVKVAKSTQYSLHGNTATGSEAFVQIVERLETKVELTQQKTGQKETIQAYQELYNSSLHAKLGTYFRTLYESLEFIDASVLQDSDKMIFINIIKSQMTDHQLFLTFCNGLSAGGAKLKKMIEKYGVLEQMPKSFFGEKISKDDFLRYGMSAYGKCEAYPDEWKA